MDTTGLIKKKIKPNFKALGPKVGKNMKSVGEEIQKLNEAEIATLEKEGVLHLTQSNIQIELNDVEIIAEDVPGWQVANLGRLTVALDIHITEELKMEGLAREFVNRIQNLRKDKDFEVTDRISVEYEREETLFKAIEINKKYISNEILADNLLAEDSIDEGDIIEIGETKINVRISKL